MLMSQCKKWLQRVPDRYKYLSKLFVLSMSLHGVFFVVLIAFYQINHPSRFNIVINQRINDAKIVFVPTIKTIPSGLATLAQAPKRSQKVAQIAPIKKTEKKAAEKKPIAKKVEPLKPKPQASKIAVVKKELKPKKIESNTLRKTENKQNEISKQPEIKKAEPKPIEKATEEGASDIIYLGRDDKALLAIHDQVQSEIEKTWRPPVGLAKDLVCSVKVKVDKKGTVLDLALEESSQVISYDIAARTALDMISFPKSLWGKEVVITFKQ